ncbi:MULTISPECIES: DUF6415 family natural product biosynthesis protein [Streptomyces]|uniref:DUF6415 family natural product biosynthesis protein n=1 Tax=Streptomyces TaxID=1883 RepID=UPI00345BB87F
MNAAYDTPLDPMTAGESRPLDLVTIRATAHRALAERASALPRVQEIREITLALRGHLELMLPEAQEHADQLPPGTTQWYCWEGLITNARTELDEGPGGGLYSAFTHMQTLATSVRLLADRFDER